VTDLPEVARRRRQAARLAGAAAITVLALLAVELPERPLGLPASGPVVEGVVAGLVVALALAGIWGGLRARRWVGLVVPAQVAVSLGGLVEGLAEAPLVTGGVALWNLAVLAGFLFPSTRATVDPGRGDRDPLGRWLAKDGPAALHLTGVALMVTVVVVGYRVGGDEARAVSLVMTAVAAVTTWRFLLLLLRSGGRSPWLAATLLLGAAVAAPRPDLSLAFLAGYLALVMALLLVRRPLFAELVDLFLERPAILVLASFLLLTLAGSVALTLPVAAAGPDPIAPVDALFTAASASCVTGLIVLDTPRDLSLVGQAVVLLLLQAGGLNIMVLSTFAAILLGRGLGLKGEHALGEVLDLQTGGSPTRLIRFIVVTTLSVEAVGAVAITLVYLRHGHGTVDAVWKGIFHSVSAFCNAGFALQSDSLLGFQRDPLMLLVVATLIVLGGLGFAVLALPWLRSRGGRRVGLASQARLVLGATAVLVAGGAVLLLLTEWDRSLDGLPFHDRVVNALFQSVTTRTAGFNSVDLAALQPASVLLMMVLMFVGASPGGTGGGIKTTTAVVLLSSILAIARGRQTVVLLGRRVPLETMYRSAAIATVAALVVVVGTGLLLATQEGRFEVLLFEAVSAFGTVGLSLGATTHLDTFGKLVVAALMLAGRVGPLSLALLLGHQRPSRVEYPEARIMVG